MPLPLVPMFKVFNISVPLDYQSKDKIVTGTVRRSHQGVAPEVPKTNPVKKTNGEK